MLSDTYKKPYRVSPISQMMHDVVFASNKAPLKLDYTTASVLKSLRVQALSSKWEPKLPIIGFIAKCSSGVAYFLGGITPKTTEIAWCGYPNTLKHADYKLRESIVGGFPVSQAWVLTGALPGWDQSVSEQDVAKLLNTYLKMSFTKFPEDYQLAAQSGAIKLWSPKNIFQHDP